MRNLVSGLVLFGCVLVSACANQVIAEYDPLAIEAETTKRLFVDGNYGQVHLRVAAPPSATGHAPLLLFHPSPYSSAFYIDFMEEMSRDRWVIVIDTPGFGDSDRPDAPPSMADYADNAARVLDELGVSEPVDVLGYHTGTLIAAELAIRQPDRVRRLVLPGVPYFTGDAQREAYDEYAKPDTLDASGDHHDSKWAFAANGLKYGMALDRAQANFADLVQSMPESGHAYYGVFSYSGETQFPKLSKPSLFIAPEGSLLNETQAAQAITPNSELMILSEYPNNVFDIGVPFIAKVTRNFLDE